MQTLIAKNFEDRLRNYLINLQKSGIPANLQEFIILNPEGLERQYLYESGILNKDKKKYINAAEKEITINFVFYPFFDSETGESHLIYSKKGNKTITVYHEPSFKEQATKFAEKLEKSFLDLSSPGKTLKITYKSFVLKGNQMDPNYALLLNFMFEELGRGVNTEKPLFQVIKEAFQTHYGENFKSHSQTLTLYDPTFQKIPGFNALTLANQKEMINPDFDDFSNVLGAKFLTESVMNAFYQTIPNYSTIPLLGTEGDEMFRSDAKREEARTFLKTYIDKANEQPNPRKMFFLLSNPHQNHWVLFVITTETGLKFTIYDSLPQDKKMPYYLEMDELVKQMNAVFKPNPRFTAKDVAMAKLKPEERQKDGVNCGVFALLQMQKILNNTESIFDIFDGESKTLKATLASYRMHILFKIWSDGHWEKQAERNQALTLPKLFSNLYISIDGQINEIKRTKQQSLDLYQEMLNDENPKNKFKLAELFNVFFNKFKSSKGKTTDDFQRIFNITENKKPIETLSDALTSKMSDSEKKQLLDALLSMQDKTNQVVSKLKEQIDAKLSSKEMKKLLPIDPRQVDLLYFLQRDPDGKHSKARTMVWFAQFDAKERKAIFNRLFPDQIKAVTKKIEPIIVNEDDDAGTEEVSDYEGEQKEVKDDFSDAVNKLSEIVVNRKYQCETECILRIADKLFLDFAASLSKPLTEKLKLFSIHHFFKQATSSSTTLTGRLQAKLKGWSLGQKSALQMGLERVNSILE
jgi:hypothetical protein